MKIGTIRFKCLRHHTEHEADLELDSISRGVVLFKTKCPQCYRIYVLKEDNIFWNDRPLLVLDITIDNEEINSYFRGFILSKTEEDLHNSWDKKDERTQKEESDRRRAYKILEECEGKMLKKNPLIIENADGEFESLYYCLHTTSIEKNKNELYQRKTIINTNREFYVITEFTVNNLDEELSLFQVSKLS